MAISKWVHRKHQQIWNGLKRHYHSKLPLREDLLGGPEGAEITLAQRQLRQISGFVTGHCGLRSNLRMIGAYHGETVCGLYSAGEETHSTL